MSFKLLKQSACIPLPSLALRTFQTFLPKPILAPAYTYIDPDYNSPLIYWWGYCNLCIIMHPLSLDGAIIILTFNAIHALSFSERHCPALFSGTFWGSPIHQPKPIQISQMPVQNGVMPSLKLRLRRHIYTIVEQFFFQTWIKKKEYHSFW